jgi:hypothetical protein
MNARSFDLTSVIDPIIESIRIRLPELVAAEVKRQLAEPVVAVPKLTDAELRQRNALRAHAGLPLLPGVGVPGRSSASSELRDARARIAAIRERRP